ncbi:TonB-dependent receptor [Bryocella elongata]|uniref:TonB-dependent receptor n=1 Tax=Bryocella elongata TaxID=863522 RepID=UPI001359D539|nr:TonB-dependent receptor [Bryocella elongata]
MTLLWFLPIARAQSGTSSALAGTVTDKSGALILHATVTATDVNTKAFRTGETDAGGHYLLSQINPATYQITVAAPGFGVASSGATAVGVGRTVTVNFTLSVTSASQSVEVTAQQGLLSLDNPNTTTTLEAKTIKSLPNPGQDLTFITQFAQGALMNTAGSSNDAKAAGGYGNVEFNGLPATSNGYILDGYDTNDPWLGLNIGLSTNLVIGLDAVQEATVSTNSYAVDQGRYGAAQVNYFTKSGGSRFHGDVYEVWNGSLLNAQDYFLHANDSPGNLARKPRSTVNEFGVSVGGPILPKRLFVFAHYEGIRIALPLVSQVTAPSPAYQQYVLEALTMGGVDPITGVALPAQPAEIPLYRSMFGLYSNTSGTPVPVSTCPLDENGVLLPAPVAGTLLNGSGCANQRQASLNNKDGENLIVLKIDHTVNERNSVWYRFQQDTGLQAAYTDPINPIFNAFSPQPQRTLVLGYTHLFTPNLVNQINPGASWYASIFEPNNFVAVQQKFPIVLAAGSSNLPFTTIGGNDQTYPQGRKVTQWQVNDNLIWTLHRHTLKFGVNTRRVDVSNYDLGQGTVPLITVNDLAQFTYGAAYTATQSFPVRTRERVANGNFEFYAMDSYKPSAKFTLTAGMRITWNTNVVNDQGLFARPAGSFFDMQHSNAQPLNQAILAGVHDLFPATPLFVYQPRVSIAYQLQPHTAVHAGFGVFSDIIPAQIADLASTNAPYAPSFAGGLGGQVGGVAIFPGVPGSAVDALVSANKALQTSFSTGAPPCTGIAPGDAVCPLAVGLDTFPTGVLKTPVYYQYSAGVEQQVSGTGAVRVDFVGTRGLHEPYQVELNGYQNVCVGCFAPYSYGRPLDQRFGSVNEFRTDANSSYAGLQTSYTQQIAGLTLRGNYTLSHCLDEVSNGGLLTFSSQGILSPLPGELSRSYGSCDYDVRHNISAFGIYQVPFHSRHALLHDLLGGWSFSETAFFHTGLPLTILSQPYTANGNGVFQSSGPQFARRIPGVPLYKKTAVGGVTVAGTRQWINPDAFASVVDPSTGACTGGDSVANCQFGDSGRNTVRGPHFMDSDIYITKTFKLHEGVIFRFDTQMFNAFNHANFALPSNVEAGVPGSSIPARFGTLQSTISPPTGLLGVGLGGDSSPRMIAFQGRIEF